MKTTTLALIAAFAATGALAQSTFSGNGNGAWGGAVGTGSLTVSDSGPNATFTFNRGSGTLDSGNALVIYIDSTAGGFANTAGFSDAGDGGRSAISGWSGSQRSTLDFASGFSPDYAISIENGYASLFQLNSGVNNSLGWLAGASQSGVNNSATYGLTFSLSDIGITPGSGQSFELFAVEVSTSGYSSPEAIGGGLTGANGWGYTQTQTSFSTYTVTAVPEPTTMALCGFSGLAAFFLVRRR
jgi:hypothetical protein